MGKNATTGQNIQYAEYGDAKGDLIHRIGDYCSFCEVWGASAALDVEHVQAKKYEENGQYIYAHLEKEWDNFLLACKNCNSVKGTKNVVFGQIHLPQIDNTFLSFKYRHGGFVQLNDGLPTEDQHKAKALMDLVGLDRRPGKQDYSSKDDRWKQRWSSWKIAEKYLRKWENGEFSDLGIITDLATRRGHWSVWVSVFKDHPIVQKALEKGFAGTYPGWNSGKTER